MRVRSLDTGVPESNQSFRRRVLSDAQLLRAIYSNWDFTQALSALIFLSEECDFSAKYNHIELRRFRCYETSAIISFSRPFEKSRKATTLGLKAIGLSLTSDELALKDKILNLRRRAVAHSDEEFMHFRGGTLQPFDDSAVRMPYFTYSESLHLEPQDIHALENLLRKLIHAISLAIFSIAQSAPHRLERYQRPLA